jgi:uncharacterized SAM-binding protein YcdF (DUF218 family)
MFFVSSKLLWIVLDPINLALLGALAGVALSRKFARGGPTLAGVCIVALIVAGASPLGRLMARPLEDRFPPPPADSPAPRGIIVLGGGIDDLRGEARGQAILREAGSRLTEAALLARRFPAARLVYTGGNGSLRGGVSKEAEQARDLWLGLGVDPSRITIETRSRNTDENARFTAAIVEPAQGEVWWLVTSAYHMPRSMGLFEKAGFDVVADPVDYRTADDASDYSLNAKPLDGLELVELAAHEWAGLVGYRVFGKIDTWFPGPGVR